MDLNSMYAPPINNACVPDIYSRLDADVLERTRVANNQLNIRLLLEQKILLKYKQEAERFLTVEKSRVTRELERISQRLPTVVSLQSFDESVSQSEHLPQQRKKKNYMAARNEDPVCHRCYIHHLPSKKRFYKFRTPHPPPPIAQDTKVNHNIMAPNLLDQKATKSFSLSTQDETGNDNFSDRNNSKDAEEWYTYDRSKKTTDRFLPGVDAFRFLDRNHSAAPRLVPNEIWKNVVKNISSQCSKHPQGIMKNARGGDIFFEKTVDIKSESKDRRPSIFSANLNREKSGQYPQITRRSSSRINIYRQSSVASLKHSH